MQSIVENRESMKKTLFLTIAAAALLCSCGGNTGTIAGKQFLNPVIKGYYSDPSILRDGEDYYSIMSSHPYYPGMTIWHSRDLVNWTPLCPTLNTYMGSIWAPDIIKHGDMYYIYFTNKQFPGDPYPSGNYVITAESITGPWSEPYSLGEGGSIDPGHVVDVATGDRYVFFSAGLMAKLTPDGLRLDGPVTKVYDGWPIPEEWDIEGFALEGPKFIHKDGYYYATWAEGGTHGPATSHMAVVARAKELAGPWENSPYNPVVHTESRSERWWSKGHGTIFQTAAGDWYIMYHAYEKDYINLGRQCLLEPIVWTQDGWPVLKKGSDPEKPIKWPVPGVISPAYFIGDHLSEFRVGLEWWFHEEYDASRYSVADGVLTLGARGESLSKGSNPLLFNAGEHAYSVSVEVEKDSTVHAGLVVYYDYRAFAGIGVRGNEPMRYRRGEENAWKGYELPDANHFFLKLVNRHHAVTIYVSADGNKWEKMQTGFEISSYQHNLLYRSKACLPGIFAAGEGQARFSNVKFEVLE